MNKLVLHPHTRAHDVNQCHCPLSFASFLLICTINLSISCPQPSNAHFISARSWYMSGSNLWNFWKAIDYLMEATIQFSLWYWRCIRTRLRKLLTRNYLVKLAVWLLITTTLSRAWRMLKWSKLALIAFDRGIFRRILRLIETLLLCLLLEDWIELNNFNKNATRPHRIQLPFHC